MHWLWNTCTCKKFCHASLSACLSKDVFDCGGFLFLVEALFCFVCCFDLLGCAPCRWVLAGVPVNTMNEFGHVL